MMSLDKKQIGQYGENLAEAYLNEKGYKLAAKNWRCSIGELDLIAWQGEMLVFIEVRTRRGKKFGSPEESITPTKQAKLIELAYTFMAENNHQDCPWRIDVIAIVLDGQNQVRRFNHIEWAVEG